MVYRPTKQVGARLSLAEMPDGPSQQVLTGQGPGVDPAWGAGAGAASFLDSPPIGVYFAHPYHNISGYGADYVTHTIGGDLLYAFSPIWIPNQWTVDGIGIVIPTAGSAGVQIRLGIYADDGSGYYPGSLVLDAGYVVAGTTGAKSIDVSPAVNLNGPGKFYLAHLCQAIATQPSARRPQYFLPGLGSQFSETGYVPYTTVYVSQAYGPLPDPFPAGGTYSAYSLHLVHVKLSGVA